MFALLGLLIALFGLLVISVCSIWFIIETFSESILWGLACLIIPFASLVFLVLHWDRAGKPFLYSLAGTGVVLFGQVFMAIGA